MFPCLVQQMLLITAASNCFFWLHQIASSSRCIRLHLLQAVSDCIFFRLYQIASWYCCLKLLLGTAALDGLLVLLHEMDSLYLCSKCCSSCQQQIARLHHILILAATSNHCYIKLLHHHAALDSFLVYCTTYLFILFIH